MKARLLVLAALLASAASTKPHIIVILADDLGWNDVSFHGSSQIPTPNIDALAFNGVVLNSHYVPALCTPSRASLMTGKYPTHTGTQHLVILGNEPWGLPLQERLLPEHLKTAGYATHAVGKWHLGFHRSEYTPTRRGFDSHYGYWNGYHDYYDHSMRDTLVPFKGYDMRRGLRVDWGARGEYSTDLFTREAVRVIEKHDSATGPLFLYLAHLAPHTGNPEDPFQAPDEEVAKFAHIEDPERRVYAAMVSKLDQSVGEVMTALSARGMLNNSIVLFLSDNGAPTFGIHSNRGSNFPLRGMKESPWEGGVRGVAALWSPLVRAPQRVSQQLMHMSDWLPTLWSAAGQDARELGDIDGVDQWAALTEDRASPRVEVLHNIDPVEDYAALRRGDWKLVEGSTQEGAVDGWYGESGGDAPRYDVNAVLRSPAGAAIAGLVTKLQIRRKGAEAPRILTEAAASALRRSSTVHCPLAPDGNATACRPREAPCLFNIRDDPCETANLAPARPLVLHSLQQSLARFRRSMVQPLNVPGDPGADPALWNGTWVSWKDGDSDGVATLPPAPTHGAPALHKLGYVAAAALSVVALTASLRRKRKTA